jgi:hypothetical protein
MSVGQGRLSAEGSGTIDHKRTVQRSECRPFAHGGYGDVGNAGQSYLVHDFDHQAAAGILVSRDNDRALRILGMQALDVGADGPHIDLLVVDPDLALAADRDDEIATRSWTVAVSAAGRSTSMPASLVKDAVTRKKISRMNTMSMSGVRLTPASAL